MTSLLDWIFGTVTTSKTDLDDVRMELSRAIEAQKEAQKQAEHNLYSASRVSRALTVTTEALDLAANRKNRDR